MSKRLTPLCICTRENKFVDPLRVVDGDLLRYHAPHRRTHHMRILDFKVVHQVDHIVCHHPCRERPLRFIRPTYASVIEDDYTEMFAEEGGLEVPAFHSRAETHDHYKRFPRPLSTIVDVDVPDFRNWHSGSLPLHQECY